MPANSVQEEFATLLLEEDESEAIAWTQAAIDGGQPALAFFQQVFTPALAAIGEMFGRLEIYLPELMDVADKAKTVSDQVLSPLMAQAGEGSTSRGTFVIASVQGDLHDIGKNMVALMLEVNGFQVVDMGINVAPRAAIDRALEVQADFLGLSSLMTTSMPYMKECVELRDGLGHKGKFWILVGGAPITAEYTETIGADGFGTDAIDAVNVSISLLESRASGQGTEET